MPKNTRKPPKVKTRRRKTDYPLPYPDFPLSPHVPTNRWYKTIRGKRYYFGPLDDWQAALSKWQDDRDDLMAGRVPGNGFDTSKLTLADAANLWLANRLEHTQAKALTAQSYNAYRNIMAFMLSTLGRNVYPDQLRPRDFATLATAISAKWQSPTNAAKAVTVVRMMLRWAHDMEHIPTMPRFGPEFKAGGKVAKRVAQRSRRTQIYSADEVLAMIDTAGVPLKAMILLGINGGYTQLEVARLEIAEVDFDRCIIDHFRGKTGARRTVPLWPETVTAIHAAIDARPKPKQDEHADLVFLTKQGRPWVRENLREAASAAGSVLSRVDAVNLQFRKLCETLGIDREGAAFGRLRHTHRTASDSANDAHAAMRIMGHDVPGISAHYVMDIAEQRLRAVADHVHQWLFGRKPTKRGSAAKSKVKGANATSR